MNKMIKYLLATMCVLFLLGCVQTSNNPNIGEIISHPYAYSGKQVTLSGYWGGWGRCPQAVRGELKYPLSVSMSAVVIFDETGCIYFENVDWISERPISLPYKPKNESIIISGFVNIDKEGTPYINKK